MQSRTATIIGLLWCLSLLSELQVEGLIGCKAKRKLVANLTLSCCRLTQPSLDKGNKECLEELSLPSLKHLTHSEQIAINACVEECNFIGSGYINSEPPYQLDMEHLQENLLKIMPQPQSVALKFMLDAYKTCEQFLKNYPLKIDIKFHDVDFIDHTCEPFALKITTCVRMYAMQECPEEFRLPLQECEEARQFFKVCVANIKSVV